MRVLRGVPLLLAGLLVGVLVAQMLPAYAGVSNMMGMMGGDRGAMHAMMGGDMAAMHAAMGAGMHGHMGADQEAMMQMHGAHMANGAEVCEAMMGASDHKPEECPLLGALEPAES